MMIVLDMDDHQQPPQPPAPAPMGGDVPLAPPPPPPADHQETFVVPSSPPPSGGNPFIPNIGGSSGASAPPPPSIPSIPSGNPWPKRIAIIALGLLLLIGVIFGVRALFTTVAGPKEVTLTYWGLWEAEPTMRAVINDFEAQNPTIKVSYVKQSHRQYRERLQAAIERGEGPDVFRFHNTWVPMLTTELAVVPETVMDVGTFESTFYPVAKADLVGGTNIYGIPLMIDGLGLYYNEDLFAAAGVTPPSTWEEVLNMVPKLAVKGEDGAITTAAIALGTTGNIEHMSDIVATMIMQNGGKLVTPTGKETEEAIVFYKKFADSSDPVYTWNDTLDNSIYAFAMGKVAMILAPSWRAFEIQQINPELRFKIAPIPQLPGNTVTWASYWVEGVSAKSKNQVQAWEFMKYLTSADAATKLYAEAAKSRLFGEPYARVDMANTIAEDPLAGAYVKQAATAKSFPLASRTFDNGINDKLIQYLTDALNGLASGSSATDVLETASAGFSQVLSTYGLAVPSAPESP